MTLTTEARFAGLWRVARDIEDHGGGPNGRFRGLARITVEGDGLRYVEYGKLSLGAAAMQATRTYLWRPLVGRAVDVRFEDGRPFHRFDWSRAECSDEHLCGEDFYRVRYSFAADSWHAHWRVEGPHKDYTSRTLYIRAADAPLAESAADA
ncbi:MAG: trigger factor [Rhodobacteraceae bacterium]|nr:MAG: trigger factor [Paracoccaceae bacterium]